MLRLLPFAAALSLASAAFHEEPYLPGGWQKLPPTHALALAEGEQVSATLSVKETSMDALKALVAELSDPQNAKYGQWLTNEEVLSFTAPRKEHLAAVTGWLAEAAPACSVRVAIGRNVHVSCAVADAAALFGTSFHVIARADTTHRLVRAAGFYLPPAVEDAVAAVFGLHGLPLPPQKPLVADASMPAQPAKVTPTVIATTYSVSGVKPSGSDKNRMSVAEFQGQYEKDSDLAQFFKAEVPNAQPGDEKVSKFVGDPDKQDAGVEASLDIQFEMGVAPHVKAEFWMYAGQDFCLDLANYTATILADSAPSLVHSVSYGWQGNLTQVQCTAAKSTVVDDNFAKIAATGVTIIFASGDSGSGYSSRPNCGPGTGSKDMAYEGDVLHSMRVPEMMACCEMSNGQPYTFTPPGGPKPSGATCMGGDIGTKDQAYEGVPKHGRPPMRVPLQEPNICCEIASNEQMYFSLVPIDDHTGNCTFYDSVSGTKTVKGAYSGKAAGRESGNCTFFKSVSGQHASPGSVSGGNGPAGKVQLWPSWPASSPFILAVGATRFVGHKVGAEEMASDQFGSGGGFSQMWSQSPHAKWQTAAVMAYTDNPPKDPHYPPAGSFPATGRATPDVSALGEGYQVVVNGHVSPVGGTSASTPAFAGMVALLNEARLQAGKPALGFMNPFVYQNADAFTDIVLGTNAIGRGNGPIKYGFNCTKGWDPATGLGTPIFSKLLAAALK